MATTGTQRRIEIGKNKSAVVTVRPGEKEVDIERNGTRWTFSVDTDYNAELVDIYDDGPVVHADLPEWVETVLDKIGIEGVDA